ncbi:hypothetical protein KI427_10280 [Rhodococcus ruber]|uniref:hypothetical protein n=1 Tax=Rhodococcus ruber TaxID=1830 RepID=UPI000E6B010E|nr:hypothetical protein [Rhodococcus ruber]AXY51706.1 hypothetical protein YT1_2282 [Rhodococcus ruber]UQB74696.1 hypothetical protein KI427_10280 [Rhodococcus ruber]
MNTPPVLQLAPDVYLLRGDAVETLRFAVRAAVAGRRRNGLRVPPDLAALAAAVSGAGRSDTIPEDVPNDEERQWITIKEAAQMLECSDRQTRRLAPGLGGRLTGGRWLLDRHAVTEHLEGRRA